MLGLVAPGLVTPRMRGLVHHHVVFKVQAQLSPLARALAQRHHHAAAVERQALACLDLSYESASGHQAPR